jgi:two-component system phosphate regulon sensor histidine kinase PhoR
MLPGDTWLAFRVQALFALLLAMALLGLVVGLAVWARRSQARASKLSADADALRARLAGCNADDGRLQAAQEAYRSFIYNLSHEVSNPLQSIQTNLDNMALCQVEDASRWRQYLAAITAEVRRMSALTDNLRLLSHLETPDVPLVREPVNLKGVVEEVLMALHETAEQRSVRLRYVGPERPARVLGDRDRLVQVLRNLVDNAIKYSRPDGGAVIIGLQEGASHVWVRVSDEGVGIAPQDLSHIFEIAYRSPDARSFRRQGSGLGLAIVKRIVDQHGGEIQIQSQPGEGSTVSFSLPVYVPPQPVPSAKRQ